MPSPRTINWIVPALTAALAFPGLTAAESVSTPAPTGRGAAIGESVGQSVDTVLNTLKWGAYGEMHYNNFQSNTTHDTLEFHRFVLLAEAQVHERVRMVSEIEIEHGLVAGDDTGEVELEQAYLGFQAHDNHELRAGVMLVPISIGNLHHEPTLFHGVERPLIDNHIVPTTWFENGIGANGQIRPDLEYTFAIQAGLDGAELKAENGVREGRQKGMKSKADDFTYTGRLDYRPIPGLWLATGALYGEMDQMQGFNTTVFLYTLEARYNHAGWDLGATWAQGAIENPEETPTYDPVANPVPEAFEGLSLTAAYDVLRLITDSSQKVYLFGRYELIDNQAEVASGATANESFTRDVFQYGITYKPTTNIVLKADYRDVENDAESAEDSWNLGVGFAF